MVDRWPGWWVNGPALPVQRTGRRRADRCRTARRGARGVSVAALPRQRGREAPIYLLWADAYASWGSATWVRYIASDIVRSIASRRTSNGSTGVSARSGGGSQRLTPLW